MKSVLRFIKKWLWNFPRTIVLCLRFPFLYPRNRFSGKYFTDSKTEGTIGDLYEETHYIEDDKMRIVLNFDYFRWMWKKFVYCVIKQIPTYTELDCCDVPSGWDRLLMKEVREMDRVLRRKKLLKDFRIEEIKQKFSTLRIYSNINIEEIEEIYGKYEKLSYDTCCVCGKKGCRHTIGYILPYCVKHFPQDKVSIEEHERNVVNQ